MPPVRSIDHYIKKERKKKRKNNNRKKKEKKNAMGQQHSAILWLPPDVETTSAHQWARSFIGTRSIGERLVCVRSGIELDETVGRDNWCRVDRPPERMLSELIRIVKVRFHFVVRSGASAPSPGKMNWTQWLDAHRHAMADISSAGPGNKIGSLVPVTRLASTVWLQDLGALAMMDVLRQGHPDSFNEDKILLDEFGARLARWTTESAPSPSPIGLELSDFRGAYFDPNVCPPLPTTLSSTGDRGVLVFRTHLWNDAVEASVMEYQQELADSEYDLIVQCNAPSESDPVLSIAEEWCRKNGVAFSSFTDRQVRSDFAFYADAWRQSQVSFVYFGRSYDPIQRWRSIWFVEYDVRYSGLILDLLRAHDRPGSHWCPEKRHLLGTHVERFDEQPEWLRWYDFPQDLRRVIRLDEQWKYFAPLTRLTPQAIRYLDSFMTATHTHHNVEIWVPSVIAFGFGHSALANLDRRFWNSETMRYRPIHAPDTESFLALSGLQSDHLYHPIK